MSTYKLSVLADEFVNLESVAPLPGDSRHELITAHVTGELAAECRRLDGACVQITTAVVDGRELLASVAPTKGEG